MSGKHGGGDFVRDLRSGGWLTEAKKYAGGGKGSGRGRTGWR
jgi:hypothetical protein